MHFLSLFFRIKTTLDIFHSIGNFIWLRHALKWLKGIYTKKDHIVWTFKYWSYHDRELYRNQDCLLSLLCSRLIFGHYLDVFSIRNSTFFGSLLLFFGSEHCSAKNESKSSVFSLKSITNLLSWNTGVMFGIFLSFENVFNIDQ